MNGFRPLVTANERSFVSLFVSFLFIGFIPRFSDRDFWSDLSFCLSFRSLVGIRRFKRLDLRLETLFLFNQLKQDFDTAKFILVQTSNRILIVSQFEFHCSVWFDSFCKPEFLSWAFWLDLLVWVLTVFLCLISNLCYCLFAIERPECEAFYYESLGFADRQQGK